MLIQQLPYKTWGKQIYQAFKTALFPFKCLVCGTFFSADEGRVDGSTERLFQTESFLPASQESIFKRLIGPFLCSTCSSELLPIEPPICSQCGFMFDSREGQNHLCGECLDSTKNFRRARSFGVYDQTLMEVIHRFKYGGKIQLARPLGLLLLSALLTYWNRDPIDLVVPVPLHAKRFRERGFNQAYLLIRDWMRSAQALNIEPPFEQINTQVLLRTVWTVPQTGLGRDQRLKNIRDAFTLGDTGKIFNKRILLVDDVYTTGATVNECARMLLEGGSAQVDVLTLARTM